MPCTDVFDLRRRRDGRAEVVVLLDGKSRAPSVLTTRLTALSAQLLFQHFAKLAEESAPLLAQAIKQIEEPETAEETDKAIEADLLNVLPDALDPRVTYGEAVRVRPLRLNDSC